MTDSFALPTDKSVFYPYNATIAPTYAVTPWVIALRRRLILVPWSLALLRAVMCLVFALQHVECVSHQTSRTFPFASAFRGLVVVLAIGQVVLVVGHGFAIVG